MINCISASLQGVSRAIERLDTAARNVAHLGTPGYQPSNVQSPNAVPNSKIPQPPLSGSPEPLPSGVDLASEEVNLLLSKRHFQANLSAIRVQNDTLATLLDAVSNRP